MAFRDSQTGVVWFVSSSVHKILCFGHRGACGHEPENTLRSVSKALELGANGIEVDVHLADGQLMVIHDDTLDRTTSGTGSVANQTFALLRLLDAGKGERIPTLSEVFDAINHRAIINIELKGPNTAEPVAQIIDAYVRTKGWRYEDFLISSFDLAQIQAAKKWLPQVRIGALINKAPANLRSFAESFNLWSLHPAKRCTSRKLVAEAHWCGLKVFVFTVNQPSEIAAMTKLGVDGMFSDYPDRLASWLHSQSKVIL